MLKTNNNYHYYLLRYCRVDAYVDRVSQSQLTINVLHAGDAASPLQSVAWDSGSAEGA